MIEELLRGRARTRARAPVRGHLVTCASCANNVVIGGGDSVCRVAPPAPRFGCFYLQRTGYFSLHSAHLMLCTPLPLSHEYTPDIARQVTLPAKLGARLLPMFVSAGARSRAFRASEPRGPLRQCASNPLRARSIAHDTLVEFIGGVDYHIARLRGDAA